MKTRKFDGADLRSVLVGLVTQQTLLAKVSAKWEPEGLFDASYANLVGGWCVKHYRKYGTPPRDRIRKIFEGWANSVHVDEKQVDAVENFLQSLSDEDPGEETPFDLDVAERYFNRVQIERELVAIEADLERGRVDEAQHRMRAVADVNLHGEEYADSSGDVEVWERAFATDHTAPLVSYRSALGKMTTGAFKRGEFYTFLAPDKTGKTAWLIDFAYQAVRQRNRVLYIDLGDSDEREVHNRLGRRSVMLPEYEGTLCVPVGWDAKGLVQVDTDYQAASAYAAFKSFRKVCKASDVMRVCCFRNSTKTVADLDGLLQDWARQGWVPDVVCMDYADILAYPRGVQDPIQATNENWKALRRMNQERDCLLITATQTKSTGYLKTDELLGPEDFSGSKGKNAHVNGILGLNVSNDDKARGITRVNWCLRRSGPYNRTDFVECAGSMALSNPCMCSRLGDSSGESSKAFQTKSRKPKADRSLAGSQPVDTPMATVGDDLDGDFH